MTVFRWILGVACVLLALGWVVSFAFYMAGDDDRWAGIAKRFRHLATVAALAWFNIEVWGSVVYTIWNWR